MKACDPQGGKHESLVNAEVWFSKLLVSGMWMLSEWVTEGASSARDPGLAQCHERLSGQRAKPSACEIHVSHLPVLPIRCVVIWVVYLLYFRAQSVSAKDETLIIIKTQSWRNVCQVPWHQRWLKSVYFCFGVSTQFAVPLCHFKNI